MGKAFNINLMNNSGIKKVHETSLKILEEIGFKIPYKPILDILRNEGAKVDYENEAVKFPSQLVLNCLKKQIKNNKSFLKNHSRYKERSRNIKAWMSLGNTYEIFEPYSHERRKSELPDSLKGILLANELDNIGRISAFVVPNEYNYNEEIVDIIQYYLLYLYSKKRYFMGIIRKPGSARCIMEMAKVVAENKLQYECGDLAEYELEAIRNLEYCKDHLSIAYEFAKNKIRVRTTHFACMGNQTPRSYASNITLLNAHILAGITVIISMNPENAFMEYISASHMLKKDDISYPLYGSPSQSIIALMAKQMADYYGFEICYTNSNLSDSYLDDFQYGFEKGVSATIPRVTGFDHAGVEAITSVDEASSFERIVLADEFISYLNFIFSAEVPVNDETIAYELIKKVGIGGNFSQTKMSTEELKKVYWDSDIFVREWYKDWVCNKDVTSKRIERKINKCLKNNIPPKLVIDESKIKKLDEIIRCYVSDKNFLDRYKNDIDYVIRKMSSSMV